MNQQERIEKEASIYLDSPAEFYFMTKEGAILSAYIAGATAERERYVEALREIIKIAEGNELLAYLELSDKSYPKEREMAKKIQSAIERAKSLL